MDMGNRFRLLINEVETVEAQHDLPKLPVACAVWEPKPDLATAAAAWIYAGGAHHTAYSKDVTTEMLIDYAEMAGVEAVIIDDETTIRDLKKELKWNDLYYTMRAFAGGV
jgi:L-arabinose isomerase